MRSFHLIWQTLPIVNAAVIFDISLSPAASQDFCAATSTRLNESMLGSLLSLIALVCIVLFRAHLVPIFMFLSLLNRLELGYYATNKPLGFAQALHRLQSTHLSEQVNLPTVLNTISYVVFPLMASVVTFPNSYLVAILLVCTTRTGSGAQILFHYPSSPLSFEQLNSNDSLAFDQTDDDTSTDSEESITDNDDLFALPGFHGVTKSQANASKNKTVGEDDDHLPQAALSQQNGLRKQYLEPIFGLAEDGLVSLLAPDRAWHKRKFELGINDLTFVGRPVFVRSNGIWRKDKKHKQPVSNEEPAPSDTATDSEHGLEGDDSAKSKLLANDQAELNLKSSLTMFHVVFVMNPPPLEHSLRVKDMYDHVIKKFSRALKWEQGHKDYVWKEAEIMVSAKAAAMAKWTSQTTLCTEILAKSSLAVAISNVYTAISNSRIASVTLSPKVSFSLQIPPVTSTSYLPSLTDPPVQPGLWLTTATDIGSTGSESEAADPGSALHLAKHYTLLLKSPPHRIAKDALEAGGPLAAHLPKFVSSLRPTKSFYKLSASSQTSLADIQVLARHLIYWRRAVAIPPLHQKDVYIVSPNADMRKLRDATKSYEQQFAPTMPNMPSLPKILSALSGIPRPFGSLIPSSDHKEIYYLALAWLMRNGWVTQLRTFIYIRVDPDVKRAVREQDREGKSANLIRQKSQRDDIGMGRDLGKSKKRPSIISRPSSEGKRSTDSNWPKHNPRMASLVLNPPRASPEESKWLDYIEASLTEGNNSPFSLTPSDKDELRKYWPLFVKYFNGNVAIETVPVREGLKRRFVSNLLGKVGLDLERGVGDEDRGNKAVLVPIRHW